MEVGVETFRRVQLFPYLRLLHTLETKKERYELKIDFETMDWATGIILWMGSDARVISPAALRLRVRQEAQKIAEGPGG